MKNLKEIDNFLDRYYLLKFNQDQIDNSIRPVTPSEIEIVINTLPTKKSPGPDSFSTEFYQTFREEIIPIFFKLFYKTQKEETLKIHFMRSQSI